MKIAIKFGDNDFINTFHPLMETLYRAYEHSGELPQTKTELLRVINLLVMGHYLLFQNAYYMEADKEYLTVTEDQLLLNEEVDEYLKVWKDGDNSSTFIIDTEVFNNNVFII
jgi:hypothetical protein